MKTTEHVLARMSQRGITKDLLERVLELGESENGEKIVLNKKMGQKILAELDKLRKEIVKIVDKGGLTVVVSGETLITAYNTNSFKRARCKNA